ncbi:MAG: hypothetical protein ABL311_04570 [Nitratireductor rhodophyticola]|uniref:hypothetical protein n=1 Tax=Nitratireductor rhodophyticola TaxID=2854036 RepID=UPI0032D9520C
MTDKFSTILASAVFVGLCSVVATVGNANDLFCTTGEWHTSLNPGEKSFILIDLPEDNAIVIGLKSQQRLRNVSVMGVFTRKNATVATVIIPEFPIVNWGRRLEIVIQNNSPSTQGIRGCYGVRK